VLCYRFSQLQQDIKVKQQEIKYAKEQLQQSRIKSPANGVLLYKSKNDLLGKPVKIGETIMRVAGTSGEIIEGWIDINDSIDINSKSEVLYYSNKNPFTAIKAKIVYSSYEAYVTPEDNIAYRVTANITDKKSNIIIGDHGQLKIYSSKKVSLFRYLLQRPVATLRQWFYQII